MGFRVDGFFGAVVEGFSNIARGLRHVEGTKPMPIVGQREVMSQDSMPPYTPLRFPSGEYKVIPQTQQNPQP